MGLEAPQPVPPSPTYQVEMGPETHSQLNLPDLTYGSREEALTAMRSVFREHGRQVSEEEREGVLCFVTASGGVLATLRPVPASPT